MVCGLPVAGFAATGVVVRTAPKATIAAHAAGRSRPRGATRVGAMPFGAMPCGAMPGGAMPCGALAARIGPPDLAIPFPGWPSHVRIVRSAAALGYNPINVLLRVLDIAGF